MQHLLGAGLSLQTAPALQQGGAGIAAVMRHGGARRRGIAGGQRLHDGGVFVPRKPRDVGGILVVKQAGKQPSWRQSYLTGLGINLTNPKVALFFVTFLPQFVSAADPDAAGKLIFLGVEFVIVSLPIVIAIVLFAEWLTRTLKENAWVGKALNWSFAAVFMAFAATILLAEGRK